MPSPSKYLATYLNDHLLGATGGTELARRAAGENEGSELGEFLADLAREIDDDRETLLAVMGELGVKADRLKVAAGWSAEKLRSPATHRAHPGAVTRPQRFPCRAVADSRLPLLAVEKVRAALQRNASQNSPFGSQLH